MCHKFEVIGICRGLQDEILYRNWLVDVKIYSFLVSTTYRFHNFRNMNYDLCDLRLPPDLRYEVITFGLLPSVAFLWFVTNVSGPYLTGPWRWEDNTAPKPWSRTKEKRCWVTTQKIYNFRLKYVFFPEWLPTVLVDRRTIEFALLKQ
jgi:hypothetical protein